MAATIPSRIIHLTAATAQNNLGRGRVKYITAGDPGRGGEEWIIVD